MNSSWYLSLNQRMKPDSHLIMYDVWSMFFLIELHAMKRFLFISPLKMRTKEGKKKCNTQYFSLIASVVGMCVVISKKVSSFTWHYSTWYTCHVLISRLICLINFNVIQFEWWLIPCCWTISQEHGRYTYTNLEEIRVQHELTHTATTRNHWR